MSHRIPLPSRPRVFWPVLVLIVLAPGCRGEPEPEVPGTFEAHVTGVLTDTLRGPATYVLDGEGRLTGLELDARGPTEGLSIELPPLAPEPRAYAVAGRRTDGGAPALQAYLDAAGHSFRAVAGTLHVERAAARRLEGAFRLEMEAPVEVPFDEAEPVTVQGRFEAAPAPDETTP